MVTRTRGATRLGPPKRPASVRTIPVGDSVVQALAAHLSDVEVEPNGLIFAADGGANVRRERGGEQWNALVKSAGLAPVRVHDLCHFYASALIRAGLSVKVVQARLGHASAVETLDVDGHLA